MKTVNARIERNPSAGIDCFGFWIFTYSNHEVFRGEFKERRINYIPTEAGFRLPEFSFVFTKDELTALANALIESGFISEEILKNKREVEALKNHLNDFRKIVFSELGISLETPCT